MPRIPYPEFDGFIYDRHGTRLGTVTEVTVERQSFEVTTHMNSDRQFVEGARTVTVTACLHGGPPIMNLTGAWKCGYCRSMQPHSLDGKYLTNCGNCGGGRQR